MLHQCFEAFYLGEFRSHYSEEQAVLGGLTGVCTLSNQEVTFEINISFTSEITIFTINN